MKAASNGHLLHDTVRDMESMLEYHEIDFDSAMRIIEQTSDFVARTIPTLGDPTVTDLDVIVNISDHSVDAVRRIDLDIYIIELRENRRGPTPNEKDDICPICCEEKRSIIHYINITNISLYLTKKKKTYNKPNSFKNASSSPTAARNVHYHFRRSVTEVRREGAVEFVGVKVKVLKRTRPYSRPVTELRREGAVEFVGRKVEAL
ncbi:hypothetical protein YC2023_015587 [Brassica napus]